MTVVHTVLLMLLAHLVADYTLQGWLADGKQKAWWDKVFGGRTPDAYCLDYIAALACHALYWSLLVCAPLWDSPRLAWLVAVNTVVHAVVDDMKANKKRINLVQDQLLHVLQIGITLVVA